MNLELLDLPVSPKAKQACEGVATRHSISASELFGGLIEWFDAQSPEIQERILTAGGKTMNNETVQEFRELIISKDAT